MIMPLVRGFVHFAALLAVGALAFAFGRWLRDPTLGSLFALLLAAVIVAVCLRRLYGPAGPAPVRARADEPDAPVAVAPPVETHEPLWSRPGLDINAASVEELTTLPGVGAVSAARIVAEREANGPFASVDDLARVGGFGPAKVRALSDLVRV